MQKEQPEARATRRGLSRAVIVARALELGAAEGLDAVSLRRLAADLGVTPMALYRHVRDKEDLVNAMTEVVLDGLNVKAGLRPSMAWPERLRRAMTNFKTHIDAHPLAMPLSIAYTGEAPVGFWRVTEDLLDILLDAGFKRRQAIVLIRAILNLVSGYLLLIGQDNLAGGKGLAGHALELQRRRAELALLSLPRQEFPNMVGSARDLAQIWLSDPDKWWGEVLDLIVFGLEAMAQKRRAR